MKVLNGAATRIIDEATLFRIEKRLAHEILEHHPDLGNVIVAAIRRGGVRPARGIAFHLARLAGVEPLLVELDVQDFRDDRPRPEHPTREALRVLEPAARAGEAPSLDGAVVILVDDVVHTGRTLRAALDALASYGRPAVVEPLVIIDRGRRELPLRATYVGKNVPTAADEWIEVVSSNEEGASWSELGVYLVKR